MINEKMGGSFFKIITTPDFCHNCVSLSDYALFLLKFLFLKKYTLISQLFSHFSWSNFLFNHLNNDFGVI